MKRTIYFTCMMLLAIASIAQPPRKRTPKPADERAEAATNKLDNKLGLTDDQKSKVYELNLSAAEQIGEIMKNARAEERSKETMRATREKVKAVNKERANGINAVLDDQQKEQFAKLREEYKAMRREHREERRENRKERREFWDTMENDG